MAIEEILMELQALLSPDAISKRIQSATTSIELTLATVPPEVQKAGLFCSGVALGLLVPKLQQPFRRFQTVDELPSSFFKQEKMLRVKAVKINDGDTFRARHLPLLARASAAEGKLADTTLQIRLAAIDTPEVAKFGNKGQPFGEEAKQWLGHALQGKTLRVQLLHKDQYARAVGMVYYGRWPFRKNASEEILKAGLATVYRQAGGVYGDKSIKAWETLEAQAKKKKLKIWSQGSKMETASEYKARIRAEK